MFFGLIYRFSFQPVPFLHLSTLAIGSKGILITGKPDMFLWNPLFSHQIRRLWHRERITDTPVRGAVYDDAFRAVLLHQLHHAGLVHLGPRVDRVPRVAARLEHERAFKVPSLRNIAERAPYMHAGQFSTLAEVLEHYNRAPAAPAGRTELKPLGLSRAELHRLEAFLRALSGGLAAPTKYLTAPEEPKQ
jgi:cytochrome c peroxidase